MPGAGTVSDGSGDVEPEEQDGFLLGGEPPIIFPTSYALPLLPPVLVRGMGRADLGDNSIRSAAARNDFRQKNKETLQKSHTAKTYSTELEIYTN
jgi:hypothetical protein